MQTQENFNENPYYEHLNRAFSIDDSVALKSQITIMFAFDTAKKELIRLSDDKDQLRRDVAIIERYQRLFFSALRLKSRQSFADHFDVAECYQWVGSLASRLYSDGSFLDYGDRPSRAEIKEAVESLISDLLKSNLDPLIKKAAHAQLSTIHKMCDFQEIFDEDEIKIRIKETMCDFVIYWERIKDYDEPFYRKLLKFVSSSTRGGRSALALAADTTEVSSLIPPSS
ncbi:MAG: hypothetical protein AAFS07_14195 [Pseudomonadota bacterium]